MNASIIITICLWNVALVLLLLGLFSINPHRYFWWTIAFPVLGMAIGEVLVLYWKQEETKG